MSVELRTNT